MPSTWGRAAVVAFAVAVAVFGNAALAGWSNWDDPLYVLGNTRVLDTSIASLLRLWSFEDAHMGIFIEYFPLRDSVYWAIHRLFGTDSLPYHAVNIIFHGICSVLVLRVGRRLSFSLPASFIAALIFAVHPVHCESVVWISGLKDPMFTGFVLAAILAYEPDEHGKRRYALSFVLFVLSMLCKSIGFILPGLLFALEWRRGNLKVSSVLAIVPFGLVALLFLANFMLIGRTNHVILEGDGGTLGPVLTSLWCFTLYISLQLMPIHLYILHIVTPIWSLSDYRGVVAVLVCGCIAIGLVGLLFKNRTLGMLGIWFVLFLLPVLNIVPIPVLVAERYLYLPSVAFALAAGAGLMQLAARHRALGYAATLIVVVGFAARTIARNEDWRGGDVALWQGATEQPGALTFDTVWLQLGEALLSEDRLVEAEQALLQAIEVQNQGGAAPVRRALAHAYLGITYLEAKQLDLARRHLNLSLGFNPNIADVWNSLSLTEAESGNPARAEHTASRALQLDPDFHSARFNRGLSRLELGQIDDGVADLTRAVADNRTLCGKVAQWLKLVGATPLAERVRAETAPHCP